MGRRLEDGGKDQAVGEGREKVVRVMNKKEEIMSEHWE